MIYITKIKNIDMDVLEEIFGDSTHLQTVLLYYNNGDRFFDNITGLSKKLGKSHVTVRKVIRDLIDAHILKEMTFGKSRVIRLDEDGLYTKALLNFLDEVESIQKGKSIESLIQRRTTESEF
jgi:hypothetical protein